MPEDPWEKLQAPDDSDTIAALRVDPKIKWNFFWARDIDNACMLILQHTPEVSPRERLPKLRGIQIEIPEGAGKEQRVLIFRLMDAAQRDIFYELCKDIVTCASQADEEKAAVAVSLARTWRWHHLLRGGSDRRLSLEEQKGLIGELIVLERYFLPHLSTTDAVGAWKGPLGDPQDFSIDQIHVESKARRRGTKGSIIISSEHQLSCAPDDALFLHVIELSQAVAPEDGFCLNEIASRISDAIGPASPATDTYDRMLLAAGFRWEDDYTDILWQEGQSWLYQVSENFPRITNENLPAGVFSIKYQVSQSECKDYLISSETLVSTIGGLENGNHTG